MKIVYVKVEELKPAEYNPRQLTQDQHRQLKESIVRFGFVDPIIANKHKGRENVIVGGHQRLPIAVELGYKEVPVFYVDLEPEREKELNLRLNRNVGQWDFEMLGNHFEPEFLLEVGFTKDELGMLKYGDDENDDKIPDLPQQTDIKVGDIFQLGEHKIICGDSTDPENLIKLLGDERIKLTFTSPPYNMGANLYQNYKDNLKAEEYIDFNMKVIKVLEPFTKGFIFWNISYNKNQRDQWIDVFFRIKRETNFKFLENIVWDKGHGMPISSKQALTRQFENVFAAGTEEEVNETIDFAYLGANDEQAIFNKRSMRKLTNYWRIDTMGSQFDNHLACFPVALPLKAIMLMTLPNDIVVDPFGGAGTTLIACEKSDRKARLVELDPIYVALTIKRWEEFSGKKAVKI